MKRLLIPLTIFALLVVPQFAAGSDLDDFKAFHEKVINAWNSLDAEALTQVILPGSIMFTAYSPFNTSII